MHDDLSELREQFPGWQIGTIWASAASGPDFRRLSARKGTILLTAWSRAELASYIRREEACLPDPEADRSS